MISVQKTSGLVTISIIGGSENNLETKKVPFTSCSYNGAANLIHLLPRFDIYFRIPLFLPENGWCSCELNENLL